MKKKALTIITILILNLFIIINLPIQVKADNTNLAPVSEFSTYEDSPSTYTANVHQDNSVVHTVGSYSIRIDAHTEADTNYARECDGVWLPISPGDHIVYGAWIKTEAFTSEDAFPGARLGFDYYINSSVGFGRAFYTGTGGSAASDWPSHPNDDDQYGSTCRVPWGSDWTYVYWDIYVPSNSCNYVYTSSLQACDPVQISYVVMWFDARSTTDNASAWFADSEFYINPTAIDVPINYLNDGFESGNTSAWTSTSTSGTSITINETESHHGNYSIQINGLDNGFESGSVEKTLENGIAELYMRTYVYFPTVSTNNLLVLSGPAFKTTTSDHTLQTGYMKNATGYYWVLRVELADVEVDYYSNLTTINALNWYSIEAHLKLADNGAGEAELYVDGVNVVDLSGLTFTVTPIRYALVAGFIWDDEAESKTVLFDCIEISGEYIGLETYTIDIVVTIPSNTTYTSTTIPYNVSTTGNDLVDSWQINLYNSLGIAIGENLTAATGSFTELSNGNYIFAVSVQGEHGTVDYETVNFTVSFSGSLPLPGVNTDVFWLFLFEGDFLGFIQAELVASFVSVEAAIAFIILLFMLPIYLRTKSLLLLSILWILIGSFFVVAVPMASGIAILFIIFGIAGLLWRLARGSSYN